MTRIEYPDPEQFNKFIEVGTIQGAKGSPDVRSIIKKVFLVVAALPVIILGWPVILIQWVFRDEDTFLVPLAGAGLEIIWIVAIGAFGQSLI